MENISEGNMDFKTLEQTIFNIMCQAACQLMTQYLQASDQIIMAQRDTREYRCIGSRLTTVKTRMGEVSYERYYYKQKDRGYIFLLDEVMGIGKGYGLVSENLAEQIVNECTDKSFRKAAAGISNLTGQTISAMGAWNVFQKFGEKISKQEQQLKRFNERGITGKLGNIYSPVLFKELDDIWLPMQKEQRRRRDASADKGSKKAKKKPLHIGTAYTGWVQEQDGRYRTTDKIAYASFGVTSEFFSNYETLLYHRFDIDGLERQVINADGASWIKAMAEQNDAILQLDPFHRSRAITRAVSDKNARQAVFDALEEKDVGKTLNVIRNLIAKANNELIVKKLKELYKYFYNNRHNLLTWQERGIELPVPPEGTFYRNLGVQEHSNCDLVTQRMKHRKGSWSIYGGTHMAKILCLKNTIGIDDIFGVLPELPGTEASAEPLSSAKTPLYDGKGYDSQFHAEMPFEQTFMTNGRRAIRNILKQRSPLNISFI